MSNVIKWSVVFFLVLGADARAQPDASGAAGATKYDFTTVLDSERDGLRATRCAAINSLGTIAVQVRDEALGINKLVTKRGSDDAPTVIADTRSVPDSPSFCDNGITLIPSDPSINDLGEVAFQGNLRRLSTREDCGTPEQRERRQGVFLGKGGPLTTIAHTINPPGGDFISEFLVADQSANTFGRVAFVPELEDGDQGLYVGSRTGAIQKRFLRSEGRFFGPSSRVSLNEVGQIAFRDNLQPSFDHGIFLSNPNGTFRTLVDGIASELAAGDPSLNIFGRGAFEGSKFVDDVQILGIFTSRGGPVTTVADSTGPYSSFREPSLNDLGKVVFTADLDEFSPEGRQVQGVFTGSNPVTDKVLSAGDLYEGVTVSSVVTCSEALNNFGQIAMTVFSENPDTFEVRIFIVRATPRRLHDDN
jgi:hypothetical protein